MTTSAVLNSSQARPEIAPGFRRLSLLTAFWIWLLIVVGGVVRVTGSGLGCPDWPLCYGQVLPPPDTTALIEFSHRFVAGVGGLLILATVWLAWRRYRAHPWIIWPTTIMIVVLPLQFVLGAIVVLTELEPLSVAVHLGTALIIFACALLAALYANQPAGLDREALSARYLNLLRAAVAALFLLLTTGAVVVGEGASYSCPDWPLCNGRVLPPPDAPLPVWLHVTHRYTVVIIGVLLLGVVIAFLRERASRPIMARWAVWLGVLFLLQAAIGAVKIWSHLATVWRVAHLGTAAAVWAVLIILAGLGYLQRASLD